MKDTRKTKAQLIAELAALRERLANLEAPAAKSAQSAPLEAEPVAAAPVPLETVTPSFISDHKLAVVFQSVLQSVFGLLYNVRNAHVFLYEAGQVVFGASLWADGRLDHPIMLPRPNGLVYQV